AFGEIVHEDNPRGTSQGSARLLHADGTLELEIDSLAMANADRYPCGGGRYLDGVVAHDLLGLAHHLPFFFGVVQITRFPIVGEHVTGQLCGMRLGRRDWLAPTQGIE